MGDLKRLPRKRRKEVEKLPVHLQGTKAHVFPPIELDRFLIMRVKAAHRRTFRAHIHDLDNGAPKARSLGQWNEVLRSFWAAEA